MRNRSGVPNWQLAFAGIALGGLLGLMLGSRPAKAEGGCPNMKCVGKSCEANGTRICTHHSGDDGGYCSSTSC